MQGRFGPGPLSIGMIVFLSACGGPEQSGEAAATGMTQTPPAPTAQAFIEQATTAINAGAISRLAFLAGGWEACLGQPWRIDAGWARWEITDYRRVIDYDTQSSVQTAQRQAGMDPERLGGCGAQPNAQPQNQQSAVTGNAGWEQQQQLWMTPLGFLELAKDHPVTLTGNAGDVTLAIDVAGADGQYRVEGHFGDDALLDSMVTWIDNPVYGDMAFEAEFSGYRDFNGLLFPGHIVQKQGGYAVLDLNVTDVMPNTDASAIPPERPGGFGGGNPSSDLPEYEAIGEGIYVLHGAYQSVVVEFNEYAVVLDGLQNDARAQDIIRITNEIIPGKPIGYVLTTHNHFDHASGLRAFVAIGATILTHERNVAFFETALSQPRTLDPDAPTGAGMPVKVQGIGDAYVLDDGSQRIEFHRLLGSTHADDNLIAWIPAIGTVVEADSFQPWINPFFGGGQHPFVVHFMSELERLGLDYRQIVPIHRPTPPGVMTREQIAEAMRNQ